MIRLNRTWTIKVSTPDTFGDLIGQARAITRLRSFVLRQAVTRALVLHGPDGVGKKTLARVLAQALICEANDKDGSACGTCRTCAARDFGITSFDGRLVSDEDFKQNAIINPKSRSLFEQQVVIIDGADEITTERLDQILKTIEEPKTRTVFVLLATNINSVRRAIRSRCFACRLSPLDDADARRLAHELMQLNGLENEGALDLVVATGMGLPMKLTSAVNVLSDFGMDDRRAILGALGLDWPKIFVCHLAHVLRNGVPIEALLGSSETLGTCSGMNKPDRLESDYARLFLLYMRECIVFGRGFAKGYHPALDLMDETDVASLASAWRLRFGSDDREEAHAGVV